MNKRFVGLIVVLILAAYGSILFFYKKNYFSISLKPSGLIQSLASHNTNEKTQQPVFQQPQNNRVFCLIKSYLKSHRNNKTAMVYNVWGHKCDDYRFIMLIPEDLRPLDWKSGEEYKIQSPFKILQPKSLVNETHKNITMKIYYAFISIYKRFPNFEWYYLVDDDSYVNVNNLKKFLATQNPSQKITFGFNFKVFSVFIFFFILKFIVIIIR